MAGEPLLAGLVARMDMCVKIASALNSRGIHVDARWVNRHYAVCKQWYEGPMSTVMLMRLTGYGEGKPC